VSRDRYEAWGKLTMSDATEPRTELDKLWDELLMDALASDGPIRDADVKNAVKHYRARIEAAARSTPAEALDIEQIVRAALRVVDQDTPLAVGEPLIQKAIRYATNLRSLSPHNREAGER